MCLLLGLLGATSSAWAITTAPSWKPRETVINTLGNFFFHEGSDRALAYDHHGNPGIAFLGAGAGGKLRYARRVPGVGWVSAVVDSAVQTGEFPSLAYDRYERPAISYGSSIGNDLKYAHFDGTMWNVETVDSLNSVGQYSSLAFDLLGRPAISYRDSTNSSLKYVSDTDGDFSFLDETPVTVVNDFSEGWSSSLVFDPLNRPMIAHFEETNFDLRFSVAEPGLGWVTTSVDSFGVTGNYPSLAIDPDTGHPAIAYYDNSLSDLRYAAWNGDSWDLTTVDAGGNVGFYPSLAFDPADGNPAISYFDSGGDDLKIAWHNGSSWQTQTVDAVGDVGLSTSLAFNDFGTGFPSIAYFDINNTLYFIEDPPAAVPEPSAVVLLVIGIAAICFRRRTHAR